MPAPFFLTHHAPLGNWSSLTFGLPGRGAAISHEALTSRINANLLIALHRPDTGLIALPFTETDPGCRTLPADALTRTLTPCIDEFSAPSLGLTLRIFTPHAALPNPKRSGNLQYATAPGLLLELAIDNSASDAPATAFVGLHPLDPGITLRPVDWSAKTLCGIAHAGHWMLAAARATAPATTEPPASPGGVFTIQSADLPAAIAAGKPLIDPTADRGGGGGVALTIPPRTAHSLHLVFAFYHSGVATQGGAGIDSRYFYTNYFPRIEAVANFLLHNAQRIRESCTSFDARAAAACPDPLKLALFSQAIRAYDAHTQVLESAGTPDTGPASHFALITPQQGFRNALDRTVDQLPWELFRNPWVIRNVFDLATSAYAYHDQLRFPSDSTPDELRDGGMTFAHDFGHASTYAPPTTLPGDRTVGGGAEPGWWGGSMATEDLLNGVYLLTSYALIADDTPWAKTRLPFARELLASMESRDHWDPEQRNGILKAQSAAAHGNETTAFAGLDPTLAAVPSNLYLAVKTFCACLMLTTYYQNNNDLHSADYSYAFAQKTAASLVAMLPTAPRMLAALEPLALPTYLGLTSTLPEYFPELFAALQAHANACLQPIPDGCLDPANGSLRLISSSAQTLPAKVINTLFVLERLFQIDIAAQFPTLWPNLAAAAQRDLADPRLIASALFVKPQTS